MNKNGKDKALCHDQQGQWSRTKGVLRNEIYTLHGVEAWINAIHGFCMEGLVQQNLILIKARFRQSTCMQIK